MRRERIRRNRRTLYLTLAGISAIILFIGVFIWLVLRGAKVQGPVASSSSSSASSTSAVTQSFKSGTYTATGDVTDENGGSSRSYCLCEINDCQDLHPPAHY